jgi:AraC-like DNA-binding protein
VGELLAIYLNDHLAGATLGVELARRLRASNRDDPEFGPVLAEVCTEIEADRETLEAVMDRLGMSRSKLKPLAAVFGERLGRLKLNGQLRGYSPLSRLDELELLQIGVVGKRRLWLALEHTRVSDLPGFDLGALAERATDQLRRLEALHLKAAGLAL